MCFDVYKLWCVVFRQTGVTKCEKGFTGTTCAVYIYQWMTVEQSILSWFAWSETVSFFCYGWKLIKSKLIWRLQPVTYSQLWKQWTPIGQSIDKYVLLNLRKTYLSMHDVLTSKLFSNLRYVEVWDWKLIDHLRTWTNIVTVLTINFVRDVIPTKLQVIHVLISWISPF